MIRTTSTPKMQLPDLNTLTINPEVPIPGILSHPSLLRPKPRKPPPQPQPPPSPQLQVPNSLTPRQRKAQGSRQRRRAHSRVSDSGWLTDEIVGGQVDDFDFEGNLGKFDKRQVWEEFRVLSSQTCAQECILMISRKWIILILRLYWFIIIVHLQHRNIHKIYHIKRTF